MTAAETLFYTRETDVSMKARARLTTFGSADLLFAFKNV